MLEGLEIKDPASMESVPSDGHTVGEVMLRGNTVMSGYYKDATATAKAMKGGWLRSGDLGVRNPDGYIQLKDRSKDIIISGDENISSIEVESALFSHPAVLDAAVVARPDDHWARCQNYGCGGYHVVRPDDNFKQGAYVMQSKLGWGHFSTAWLAWDTAHSRSVAVKVQKSAQHYSEAAMDEIKILMQIADGDLEDSRCVVKLLDHFKHTSPNESHVCMVFEFLGDNLLTLIKYTDYRSIPLPMVKEICRHVLIGLDYLHRELSIIHTDLKPEDIFLVSTIDPSNDPRKSGVRLVPPAARAIEPPPRAPARPSTSSGVTRNQQKKIRKKAKHVVVSTSEGNGAVAFADIDESDDKGDLSTANEGSPSQDGDMKRGGGYRWGNKGTRNRMAMKAELGCKMVDFGNACWTYKEFTSDIQTRQYRCPEVLLGSKYSTSVDLWSFACICFELASEMCSLIRIVEITLTRIRYFCSFPHFGFD
uniref:non-specific serine/threonine protein kinase n=1 Tax=Hordeum vulgare subsp. vulgare TaxID=112509 RepID=A0A8I6WNP0_HORVV